MKPDVLLNLEVKPWIAYNGACFVPVYSFSESQFSQGNIPGGSQQQPSNEQSQTQQNIGGSQLISCPDDLTKLLENCCVVPISDQEFVPSDTLLPPDFWESNSEAELPMSLIRELDFWCMGWINKKDLWIFGTGFQLFLVAQWIVLVTILSQVKA